MDSEDDFNSGVSSEDGFTEGDGDQDSELSMGEG